MADAPPEREPDDQPPDENERDEATARPDRREQRGRGALDPILSIDGGLVSALAEDGPRDPAPTDDRWAHRRGEPRLLALLWSIYLFGAAISTVMRIPVLGMTDLRFVQNASRMLLLLIAVGLVVLWPMVRLSQSSPRRPLVATLLDLALLNATLQAVVWPLTWLGKWPAMVTAGVVLMLLAWSLVVGGFVACGTARPPGLARSFWMLLCLVCALGAPGAALLSGGLGASFTDELALASPLTAVYALTTGPSGLSPSMNAAAWASAWAPAAAAVPLWALAALRTLRLRRDAGTG